MSNQIFILAVTISGTLFIVIVLVMRLANSMSFSDAVKQLEELGWENIVDGELSEINNLQIIRRVRETVEFPRLNFGLESPSGLKYLVTQVTKKGSSGNNLFYCERFLLIPYLKCKAEFIYSSMSFPPWEVRTSPEHLSVDEFIRALRGVKKRIKPIKGLLRDDKNEQIVCILTRKGNLSDAFRAFSEVSRTEINNTYFSELSQLSPLLKYSLE